MLGAPVDDPVLGAWTEAEADARAAYDAWRLNRERDSYVAYRACADRADAAQDALAADPGAELDYLAVVDPATFRPVDDGYRGRALVLVAARVGGTRLIDNRFVHLG